MQRNINKQNQSLQNVHNSLKKYFKFANIGQLKQSAMNLENFLNAMVTYDQVSSNQSTRALMNANAKAQKFANLTEYDIDQILNSTKGWLTLEQSMKIAKTKSDKQTNEITMMFKTQLQERRARMIKKSQELKRMLKDPPETFTKMDYQKVEMFKQELTDMIKTTTQLENEMVDILGKDAKKMKINYDSGVNSKKATLASKMRQFNDQYNQILINKSSYLAATQAGIGLEIILASIPRESSELAEDLGKATSQNLTDPLFEHYGSQKTGSSNLGAQMSQLIKYDAQYVASDKSKKNLNLKKRLKNKSLSTDLGNVVFTSTISFNPDRLRDNKIDIKYQYQSNQSAPNFAPLEDLSLKSWTNYLDDNGLHTFGASSLSYILYRIINEVNTFNYIDVLSLSSVNRDLQTAHQVAKLSILLDTLIGWKQKIGDKPGGADAIVIYDRGANSKRPFHVYSLKAIMSNYNQDIDSVAIQGYKENEIQKTLQDIYSKKNKQHLKKIISYAKHNYTDVKASDSQIYHMEGVKYLTAVSVAVSFDQMKNVFNASHGS